mgnify:CR=1 FL=1
MKVEEAPVVPVEKKEEKTEEKLPAKKQSLAQDNKESKDYYNAPANSNTGVLRETNLENLVKDKSFS